MIKKLLRKRTKEYENERIDNLANCQYHAQNGYYDILNSQLSIVDIQQQGQAIINFARGLQKIKTVVVTHDTLGELELILIDNKELTVRQRKLKLP